MASLHSVSGCTGVERLAQKLAERQKRREHEEEMMEQRLQRLRQQRNAMASRHRRRERSKSVERESPTVVSDPLVCWLRLQTARADWA